MELNIDPTVFGRSAVERDEVLQALLTDYSARREAYDYLHEIWTQLLTQLPEPLWYEKLPLRTALWRLSFSRNVMEQLKGYGSFFDHVSNLLIATVEEKDWDAFIQLYNQIETVYSPIDDAESETLKEVLRLAPDSNPLAILLRRRFNSSSEWELQSEKTLPDLHDETVIEALKTKWVASGLNLWFDLKFLLKQTRKVLGQTKAQGISFDHYTKVTYQNILVSTLVEKMNMLHPVVPYDERIERADWSWFRLFGPLNPYLEGSNDAVCAQFGGCRMFTCLHHVKQIDCEEGEEGDRSWFTGKCRACSYRIGSERRALRLPNVEGGWEDSCYCCEDCAYTKIESELQLLLFNRMLAQLKKIKVY